MATGVNWKWMVTTSLLIIWARSHSVLRPSHASVQQAPVLLQEGGGSEGGDVDGDSTNYGWLPPTPPGESVDVQDGREQDAFPAPLPQHDGPGYVAPVPAVGGSYGRRRKSLSPPLDNADDIDSDARPYSTEENRSGAVEKGGKASVEEFLTGLAQRPLSSPQRTNVDLDALARLFAQSLVAYISSLSHASSPFLSGDLDERTGLHVNNKRPTPPPGMAQNRGDMVPQTQSQQHNNAVSPTGPKSAKSTQKDEGDPWSCPNWRDMSDERDGDSQVSDNAAARSDKEKPLRPPPPPQKPMYVLPEGGRKPQFTCKVSTRPAKAANGPPLTPKPRPSKGDEALRSPVVRKHPPPLPSPKVKPCLKDESTAVCPGPDSSSPSLEHQPGETQKTTNVRQQASLLNPIHVLNGMNAFRQGYSMSPLSQAGHVSVKRWRLTRTKQADTEGGSHPGDQAQCPQHRELVEEDEVTESAQLLTRQRGGGSRSEKQNAENVLCKTVQQTGGKTGASALCQDIETRKCICHIFEADCASHCLHEGQKTFQGLEQRVKVDVDEETGAAVDTFLGPEGQQSDMPLRNGRPEEVTILAERLPESSISTCCILENTADNVVRLEGTNLYVTDAQPQPEESSRSLLNGADAAGCRPKRRFFSSLFKRNNKHCEDNSPHPSSIEGMKGGSSTLGRKSKASKKNSSRGSCRRRTLTRWRKTEEDSSKSKTNRGEEKGAPAEFATQEGNGPQDFGGPEGLHRDSSSTTKSPTVQASDTSSSPTPPLSTSDTSIVRAPEGFCLRTPKSRSGNSIQGVSPADPAGVAPTSLPQDQVAFQGDDGQKPVVIDDSEDESSSGHTSTSSLASATETNGSSPEEKYDFSPGNTTAATGTGTQKSSSNRHESFLMKLFRRPKKQRAPANQPASVHPDDFLLEGDGDDDAIYD